MFALTLINIVRFSLRNDIFGKWSANLKQECRLSCAICRIAYISLFRVHSNEFVIKCGVFSILFLFPFFILYIQLRACWINYNCVVILLIAFLIQHLLIERETFLKSLIYFKYTSGSTKVRWKVRGMMDRWRSLRCVLWRVTNLPFDTASCQSILNEELCMKKLSARWMLQCFHSGYKLWILSVPEKAHSQVYL